MEAATRQTREQLRTTAPQPSSALCYGTGGETSLHAPMATV
jgi:hypothetical protein